MLPGAYPAPMPAAILDGKALASSVRALVRDRVTKAGRPARLDAVLVGADPAAELYAQSQGRTCAEVGIEYRLHRLPAGSGFEEIAGRVLLLNEDDAVRAIMVHLPLPAGVDVERVQSLISPEKDVEGVNPANIGNVVYGRRSLVPCTARAVVELVESSGVSKTPDLGAITRQADILVVAIGRPRLVTRTMLKPGAVIIDVGINRLPDGKLAGDVDFADAQGVAACITPVPGGVGPMTITMLIANTIDAAERAARAG